MVDADIGGMQIREIEPADLLAPLKRIEARGNYETAQRMQTTISQVFRYAIANGCAKYDMTFSLRGALTTPTVTSRAAIVEWASFENLIRKIWTYDGMSETVSALKLMALLYPRPGELRQAEWREVNLEAGIWSIPAARMKMRKPHKKPLPELAVDILCGLRNAGGATALVFPSQTNPRKPMRENTPNQALPQIGFTKAQMTSHGFRASAFTLPNEYGLWNSDAIDAELAHIGSDKVRNAYHRGVYWDERARMSEWWAGRVNYLLK